MARKPSARVVLNRAKLDEVSRAVADGFAAFAEAVVREAAPMAPDSPLQPYPTGEGLPKQGGWLVYVGGQKIAGGGLDGKQPKKPRAVQVRQHGIVAIAGYGFPGRFQEQGTVNHPARPFLGPAFERVAPRATEIMRPVVDGKLRRIG